MKQIIMLLFTLLGVNMYSQQSTLTAGGEAVSMSGNVSFSVGQSVYTYQSDWKGSSSEGVQQPYQITELLDANTLREYYKIAVYPNPTADHVTLQIENFQENLLTYQLFDLNGKILLQYPIEQIATLIPMVNLSSGSYLLKLTKGTQEVAIFKILKNN